MTDSTGSATASGYQKATFAAGCFWGVEAAFRKIDGVVSTAVGYIGGTTPDATYKQVCAGGTGHAEAVEVVFDPDKVSYDDLLEAFWNIHDPTTKNRQGPDVGSQYRSAIFCHNDDQRDSACASRDALQAVDRFASDIVTEIVPAGPFYLAEDYHQQYLEKRGQSSCGI